MIGRKAGSALLVALAMGLGMGCASEEKPTRNRDKSMDNRSGGNDAVPMTAEPQIDEVPDNYEWKPFFKRATCIVVPYFGEKMAQRQEEVQDFINNLEENLFSPKSCLKKVDQNALQKAAERRSLLGQTPAGSALTDLANKEKVDFVVCATIEMIGTNRTTDRADVGAEIIGKSTVTLRGSAAKSAQEIKFNFDMNQYSSSKELNEYRRKHATVMGRLIAKKILAECKKANELVNSSISNDINITFKFGNDQKGNCQEWTKQVFEELLKKAGHKTDKIDDDMEERSAADTPGQFNLVVKAPADISVNAFKNALALKFEENDVKVQITVAGGESGNSLVVKKSAK